MDPDTIPESPVSPLKSPKPAPNNIACGAQISGDLQEIEGGIFSDTASKGWVGYFFSVCEITNQFQHLSIRQQAESQALF